MTKHIVILGGGYGGLLSALTARKHLSQSDARITVVNRFPTHQIITELHRLAAGNLSEKAVALPLEKLFRGKNIDFIIDTVDSIHFEDKEISLEKNDNLHYDLLVVALGSQTAFFGIPGLEEHSFKLKSVDDAKHLHAHIEKCIENYSRTGNKADATFVVGGGGLTGIELIGEFADLMPQLCKKYRVNRKDVTLICVEAGHSILKGFPDALIKRAQSSLESRGVQFTFGFPVTNVDPASVELKSGRRIETNTLVWTGGVQGNDVVANSGLEVNRGRVPVNEYLQSAAYKDVFFAGDCAIVMGPDDCPYPPTAQLSWQMGENIGFNLFAHIKGGAMAPFEPVFSGTLGSLGRKDAVGMIGGNQTQIKGLPASLMKEASNVRYLSHIKGLFSLAY
ncbi:NAD(P)/FAD-dependent oxidoreductase [Bacillus sp. Marseille-P3661]|uniref:NAD(P)/FAD-dependent oxidoreductase n=1 Tax=Bacillus sp. Marseille-P3661 TaxID=1936234 RepID=UPI000C847AB0|nr:NAD(P)/FAD-dependent oxidoreductase [Bacillus sp. Marseille-P3661]